MTRVLVECDIVEGAVGFAIGRNVHERGGELLDLLIAAEDMKPLVRDHPESIRMTKTSPRTALQGQFFL